MSRNALILSEPFGGGHTKAAEALVTRLEGWNSMIYELGNYLHPRLTSHLARGYLKTVEKAPWIWGKIYSSSLSESYLIPYMYRKVYFTKLAALLLKTKPDVILSTHPIPAAAISSLRKYKIHIPLIGVVTDFHIHPSWSLAACDVLCVPSPEIPEWMGSQTSTSILSTGIPVRPEFQIISSKEQAKRKLSLDQEKPVVLWMGGSNGIAKNMIWVQEIKKETAIQWIFVTGKNAQLRKSLEETLGPCEHIKVYGYVQDISALMDASDLLITKPGGVTCSEAIHKELPIVLIPGITGQEEENIQFLLGHGLADATDTGEIREVVQSILNHPSKLDYLRWNMKRYKRSIQLHCIPAAAELFLSQDRMGS